MCESNWKVTPGPWTYISDGARMDKQTWDNSADANLMLEFLFEGSRRRLGREVSHPVSDRKMRLFGVACCRQAWGLMGPMQMSRLHLAEEFQSTNPDCTITPAAAAADRKTRIDDVWIAVTMCASPAPGEAAREIVLWLKGHVPPEMMAHLLRDIAGDPFEDTVCPADAATPEILSMLDAMDKDRDPARGYFDPVRLSIIADALEERGHFEDVDDGPCMTCCDSGKPGYIQSSKWPGWYYVACGGCRGKGRRYKTHPLLTHLRSAGPHVRGCWAVDLLRGKK